jgi:hypothetical protein
VNVEPRSLVLEDVSRFARRFVVLTDEQLTTLALWVSHTFAAEASDTTPYIAVTSAEKRSGKTRLLEVLELLVHEPLPTANISDAALFRAISELTPTLLLDEVDAIFGPKARDREDLRGMLNAGYRRGTVARRMGGPKMTTLEAFPVFCPKVFAGIGELPDTLNDRSIRIRLERRTRDEPIERFRRRDVGPEAAMLHDRIADWLEPQLDELLVLRPPLPDELDDRQQDCWEPLLAIAELAGGDWPQRARHAALTLSGNGARDDDSLTARLLADIHAVFQDSGESRYRTADLIEKLSEIEESPWGDWRGKPITAHALSRLLKPFGIRTQTVRTDGVVVRGYKREQFADAFHRVLGVTSVTSVTSGLAPSAGSNAGNACNASGTNGRRPLLGDPGYPMLLDRAYAEGHLTADELRTTLMLNAAAARARLHEPADVDEATL